MGNPHLGFTPQAQSHAETCYCISDIPVIIGLVYWGLTPQQQPGPYQGGEMMMKKSAFWWRKPGCPEETTDLRQVTDETFMIHMYLWSVQARMVGGTDQGVAQLQQEFSPDFETPPPR